MSDVKRCPYCVQPVSGESVVLWDARVYCRRCVEQVSPELYKLAVADSPLEDTLCREDVKARRYVAFVGRWLLVVVTVIFGVPSLLMGMAGNANAWMPAFFLAFFGGGGFMILGLQSLIGAALHRLRLPRTLSVENGQLIIKSPKDEQRVPIAECKWQEGFTGADQTCLFTGLQRGIVIQTPDHQLGVGHSPDAIEHWRSFLVLARIPENRPSGCLRLIAVGILGMFFGLLLGCLVGGAVELLTGNNDWMILGLMGLIEGGLTAVLYATCTVEGAVAARRRLHPALVAMLFFVLGIKFGAIAGLQGALACGGINAILGGLVGWLCTKKIAAAEQEQRLADEFGSQPHQ